MHILCSHKLIIFKKLNKVIISTRNRTAVDVAYKLYGPEPSVNTKHILVLHGLLGFKRNWDGLCKKIAAATQATVIAADARNHGDSPHTSSHTYTDLASDVFQLLTKLSIKKVHAIGHSMGGRTAMVVALTEPSKVISLVAVDISPVPGSVPVDKQKFFEELMDIMKSVDFRGSDLNKARITAKEKLLSSGLVSEEHFIRFLLMNIGQFPDKSCGWKYNLDVLRKYFPSIASFPSEMAGKQYSGPTLFIGGTASDFLPPSHLEGIKKFFPIAELKYIENVGHNVHAEDPEAFINMLNIFLAHHL